MATKRSVVPVNDRFNPNGDADFVLMTSGRGPAYRVHKERLALAPFFRDMFASATAEHDEQESIEGLPAVTVEEPWDQYVVVLAFLYDCEQGADVSKKSYGELLRLRELANKLDMRVLIVVVEAYMK